MLIPANYNNQFADEKTVSACLILRDILSSSGEVASIKDQLKTADKATKITLGQELNMHKLAIKDACDNRIQAIQLELEKDNFVEFDSDRKSVV